MDMNLPTLLPPPDALRHLLDQVMAGRDAVVDGPGASVLLDQAAALLAARRLRVLRAAAAGPEGLGLQELMAQVAGGPDAGSPDGTSLEQGAQALTVLDGRCDGIVLLLDDAETVQPTALRYIQLACRTSAKLRLVLAGMPEGLDGAEFASLRARLQAQPVLVLDGSLPNVVPQPAPRAPAARPEQPPVAWRLAAPPSERPKLAVQATSRRTWLAAAALGMAGCVAVGVLAARHTPERPGGAAAMVPATQPTVPPMIASEAPVAVTTPTPAVEAPAISGPASASPDPGLAAAGQAAAEPLPLPPARPPGRSGAMSHQADARFRALPPHGDRRNSLRLPRANAGHPSFSTAQHGSAWDEPSADSRDEQRYAPQGWSGSGWQGDAYPGPVAPPGYASGPYARRDYPYEPWRRVEPWWPR
ncbi:MAG: hypothetical protein ACRYGM_16800 [Janthinobacterium lividum]